MLAQGFQDGHQQFVFELIHMNPLRQYAVGLEIAEKRFVVLARKKPGNAADPGVGGLGYDNVVLTVVGAEKCFRVLDINMAARVRENPGHQGLEQSCALYHPGLNLDGIDAFDFFASQQRMAGHSRAEAHHRHIARIRMHSEREDARQRHREFVSRGVQIFGTQCCVRFAVGDNGVSTPGGVLHTNAGRGAIAVINQLIVVFSNGVVAEVNTGAHCHGIKPGQHRNKYKSDQRGCRQRPEVRTTSGNALQQRHPERQVHQDAAEQRPLQAQHGYQQGRDQHHPHDGAKRIDGIDPPYHRLATAALAKNVCDERQRHARAKGRRQHD